MREYNRDPGGGRGGSWTEVCRGGEAGAFFLYDIDGVTALRVFLEAGDFEARVALAGEFGHADTIGVRRVGDAGLVRRMGGGDEEDAVEAVACGGLAREGEMAIVDGIEGAAEDRQFHAFVGQLVKLRAGWQPALGGLATRRPNAGALSSGPHRSVARAAQSSPWRWQGSRSGLSY